MDIRRVAALALTLAVFTLTGCATGTSAAPTPSPTPTVSHRVLHCGAPCWGEQLKAANEARG